MPQTAYIWSQALQNAADDLPANLGRSSAVHSLIRALGLTRTSDEEDTGDRGAAVIVAPDAALGTQAELARYHAPGYVEYLLQARGESSSSEEDSEDDEGPRKRRRTTMGLEHDCPPFASLPAYATLLSAATLTACRLLSSGAARTTIVWDGGRHHALKSRASGFCYVADAVLGILALTRAGVPAVSVPLPPPVAGDGGGGDGAEEEEAADSPPTPPPPRAAPAPRARILYLDLDLHYGDGVAQAFASPTHYPYPLRGRPRPPQVLTLSIHHAARGFFPPHAPGTTPADTAHPFSLSLGLAAYASCRSYASLWGAIEKVKAAFRPHYVVLQLGVDGLPRDPVGQYGAWGVSGPGSSSWVVQRVKDWDLPTCVLGGGGYDSPNAARAWALATAVLLGRGDLGAESDVPDHDGFEGYAPGYTLEVEPSHIPDENTQEELDAANEAFAVLASRIAQIVDLHDKP